MLKKIFLYLIAFQCAYSQYPSGFQEESFGSWDLPMGVTFDSNNKMYVWERDGRVYSFLNNQKSLLIDIREEVATYGDFGLLSMALDPNFSQNGYVYLYYVVDRHHLLNFGSVNYSANSNEQGATISRLTRYTLNPADSFNSLLPNSRLVLIGETKSTGFPITGIYHAGGDLKFSLDGSLLVSCGDGAVGADYEDQAYQDGILSVEEYNAKRQWRCQIQNSLNGKIVRINPSNGNGLESNPFFNGLTPRSAQSRMWAMGFRNPFRFTIKPNTGSHDIAEGHPGILYVGDVGQETKEEIDVVNQAGQNFGWPRLEGIDFIYSSNPTYHPINPRKPTIEWGRSGATARVVVNDIITDVGASAFPYSNFTGGCSIGGVFYEGTNYPIEYQGGYFFAEFNDQWVKNFKFDSNNNPVSKIDFQSSIPGLIYFTYNSFDQSIYFTAVTGVVKKIKYAPLGNQAPKTDFVYTPKYGLSPLVVDFDASSSTDPENSVLTYNWNFGDGSFSSNAKPNHQFVANGVAPQSFSVTLTVTDIQGLTNSLTNLVSVNNTPPKVLSTSLDSQYVFLPSNINEISLNAQVSDSEESNSTLSYKWEVYLYHNEHRHQELNVNILNAIFLMGQVPCDNILYYYKFILTVTDSYGLKTTFQKDLFPDCNIQDNISPTFPNLKIDNITNNSYKLSWNQVSDNDGIKNIEVVVNGETKKFLSGSSTEYTYLSSSSINGINQIANVIVRDYGSNFTKSSTIYFTPTSNCSGENSEVYLSNLSENSSLNGYGPIEKDKSNGGINQNDGNTLKLNGVSFSKGIGGHSYSEIIYNILNLGYENFTATIGLDDEVDNISCGSVIFKVYKDNVLAYQSPSMNDITPSILVNLNVLGVNQLKLVIEDAGDGNCGDHGDWANAKLSSSCISNDALSPSTPLNFSFVSQNSGYSITWNASLDQIDTQLDYEVFLNGVLYGNTSTTSYFLQNLENEINYVTVQAKDDMGNRAVSNTLVIKKCPSSLIILQNESISNQTISKKASNIIQANNTILNQSNVIYQAGNSIQLNPGFYIMNGSVFLAKIGGCNN